MEHPHVKAVFGCKKNQSSQNRFPKMAVFRKFEGLNIKYSHRNPPKGTSLPGTTYSDVLCVTIRLGV